MRRKDKEIIDRAEITAIIRRARVCRLGLCDGDQPYIVPMSFGLRGEALYFHCAREGKKLDLLRANPKVCFEFETDVVIEPGDSGCDFGTKYRSVIGFGTAAIVENPDERLAGLEAIIRQYADLPCDPTDAALAKTLVFRVDITEMTGKQSG